MILGIDPDTHNTGICLHRPNGGCLLDLAHVKHKYTGTRAVIEMAIRLDDVIDNLCRNRDIKLIIIENQEAYIGRGSVPNRLLVLAQVTGACISLCTKYSSNILCPKPKEWKGQVPKDIHNKRVLEKMGTSEDDLFKGNPIPKPQRHHVIDAIGLALWGTSYLVDTQSQLYNK